MENQCSIELTLKFEHAINVFVLQMGGWSTLPFTSASVLLLDRNVISAIKSLDRAPKGAAQVAQRSWLAHLDSKQFLLNPALAAIEGGMRRIPTLGEYSSEIMSISKSLKELLPNSEVVSFDEHAIRATYEMFKVRWVRTNAEGDFLRTVCPLIASKVSANRLSLVEDEVLTAASEHRLERSSIVVVAVLSCLYESNDGSELPIGRRVLKPSLTYTESDAHNALSDLCALEFLASANGLITGSVGLCTGDRCLVALWVGLGLHGGDPEKLPYQVTSSPRHSLFPRLPQKDLPRLVQKLRQ